MSLKIDKDNKTFCLAPWISAHIWPSGNTYPCCLWDIKEEVGNINDSPLKEIWNNDKMKETRVSMMKGESIPACSRCDHLGNSGIGTYREHINEVHSKRMEYLDYTHEDGTLDVMNLHLWDFRLSNFCNFKCRSCGLGLSSSWFLDTVELGKNEKLKEIGSDYHNNPHGEKALITVNDKVSFLDMIEDHYSCVDEVYFAGGEPLMMPEHYKILDRLIEEERTDVLLRYSTNFSNLKFKGKHVFDYWHKFKKLQLWISIDGVGALGEYVRKGFNDKKFEENINEFKQSGLTPPDIGYMVTYGALNYLHLFDLVLDFIKREYVDYRQPFQGNKLVYFSPISYPKHYDCMYLPSKYKHEFLERLVGFDKEMRKLGASENFIWDVLKKLNIVYNRSIESEFDRKIMKELIVTTQELDNLRSEKFEDIFTYFNSINDLEDDSDKEPFIEFNKFLVPNISTHII